MYLVVVNISPCSYVGMYLGSLRYTKLGSNLHLAATAQPGPSQRQPGSASSEPGCARSPQLGCSSAELGAARGSSRLQPSRGNTTANPHRKFPFLERKKKPPRA